MSCSPESQVAADRCWYVQNNTACAVDGIINYLTFVYCSFDNTNLVPLGILICVLWLLVLFIGLSVAADGFFCPSLNVIVEQLKISENIAGVTFLAFGNGAPDIFSAIAATAGGSSTSSPDLMFGALFGAGMFVTTVVVGSVTLVRPFPIMQRPFLRDVTFYLGATFFAFYVMYTGHISIGQSIGFICIYVVYVLVVVLGQYVRRRMLMKRGVDDLVRLLPEQQLPLRLSVVTLASITTVTTTDSETVESITNPNYVDHTDFIAQRAELPDDIPDPPTAFDINRLVKDGHAANGGIDNSAFDFEHPRTPGGTRIADIAVASAAATVAATVVPGHPPPRMRRIDSVLEEAQFHPAYGHILSLTDPRYQHRHQHHFTDSQRHHHHHHHDDKQHEEGARATISDETTSEDPNKHTARPPVNPDKPLNRTDSLLEESQFRAPLGKMLSVTESSHIPDKSKPPKKPPVFSLVEEEDEDQGSSYDGDVQTGSINAPDLPKRPADIGPIAIMPETPRKKSSDEIYKPETASQCSSDIIKVLDHDVPVSAFPMLFWKGIRPFSGKELAGAKCYQKVFLIVQLPVLMLLKITIPLIDMEADLYNWNKPLILFQFVVSPVVAVLLTDYRCVLLGGYVPVAVILLIIGILVSTLIGFTSVAHRPPRYYKFIAYGGFAMAVVWINALAGEIVNILSMIGNVLKISNSMLGLTLLAWANSLGDCIANISVARSGFPRMAVSACFGGPMFNLLVGVGISFTIFIAKHHWHNACIKFSGLQQMLVLFLGISLVFSFIFIPLRRFRATRLYAGLLISLYAAFLVCAVLTEVGVIPEMGEFTHCLT